jgi:hypothetical protein
MSQDAELLEAWRAVANAKLNEYRRQCWRLAHLVRKGAVQRLAAVDRLSLVRSLGEDRVQAIINEAFANADFRLMHSEVA